MKIIALVLGFLVGGMAQAAESIGKDSSRLADVSFLNPSEYYSAVFCGRFSDSKTEGFSLYRASDNRDIGNAVWKTDLAQCQEAASEANYVNQNIVCGVYYNAVTATSAYSLYRISDGKDLGRATIATFQDCQYAVTTARYGMTCSTYTQNDKVYWSLYNIETGADLGKDLYESLDRCVQAF